MATKKGTKRPDVVLRNKSKKQKNAVKKSWDNEEIRKKRIEKIKQHTGEKKATYGHKGCKHLEETKKRISIKRKGKNKNEKHHMWAGNDVGYAPLHSWVNRNKTKEKCLFCGSIDNLQWSNKDHKYKRDLDDYNCLCAKCHNKYDRDNNLYGIGKIYKQK